MAKRIGSRLIEWNVHDNKRETTRSLDIDQLDPDSYIPPYKRSCISNRSIDDINWRVSTSIGHNQVKRKRQFSQNEQELNSKTHSFNIHREAGWLKRSLHRTKNISIGFRMLEEWATKDANEIIVTLIAKKAEFVELLESNKLFGDTMVLVTKILAKVCSSTFNANKSYIMSLASQDQFIQHLQNYLFDIQLQEINCRSFFWADVNGFFNSLNIICASLIEAVPTKACEVLPKTLKAIIVTIEYLISSGGVQITNGMKTNFEKLQEKLSLCNTEIEQKKIRMVHNNLDGAPPDNFRELTVYPSSQEILSGKKAFVRRNVIDGSYLNVDHYLDVQFRLLKEDFVAPLREGIGEFMNCDFKERKRMKFSNVRIHHRVEFICPYFHNQKVGFLLQFGFNKKKIHNYHYSKTFMFGSLLCFTKDNFATIIFGKVIERNRELLEQQQIVVEFEPGKNNFEYNKPYLMVECSIYFEPYYHVLKALQNIYEDSFPMKKYFIDVNPVTEPPAYVDTETCFNIKSSSVRLLTPEAWTAASKFNFDDTQYIAFKAALTQSFSVIQGPPGTGKTFLGIQIAKTLINNESYWHPAAKAPILVVCFTNHALDQFLDGLIGTTDRILRVGGQSKNTNLDVFNIRNKRHVTSEKTAKHSFYNAKMYLQQKLHSIKYWSDRFDVIEKYDSIIQFDNFAFVDPGYSQTWFASASNEAIIQWLLGGRTRAKNKIVQRQIDLNKLLKVDSTSTKSEINPDMELYEILEAEHRNSVEDFHDSLDPVLEEDELTCLLSLENIATDILCIRSKLKKLKKVKDQAIFSVKREMQHQLLDLQENLAYLKMRLNEGKRYMLCNKREKDKPANLNLREPHHMPAEMRWKLYYHWLNLYKTSLMDKLVGMREEYKVAYQQYIELKDIDDIQIMRRMLVVGMTTTAAARLQSSLQSLKCRIVIVEEAAEVLESHIVVSLTNSCQQLIIIGDHKQLRPSTATYKLEKNFNLGISLFERMVRNKIQCHVLGVQHRMRPEFAKLIVPIIYPILENHKSVEDFPPVFGVTSNLYFINHNSPEKDAGDSSKENLHEAKFLIALAKYLIQNGYKPEDITILAAYSGQMFALWRLRSTQELLLKDVRITVLDNYQGEESRIILLSLVRNNEENKIGFLKIENRVCVALSRAREGLYIMGNMDILCRNSEIWPKIKETLVEQHALGANLSLQCQVHPQTITIVKSANDFTQVPEGGCGKVCSVVLKCGHTCSRICHIIDRVHEVDVCKFKCEKVLCEETHRCQKLCYEECGKCQVLMKRSLLCGHEHVIPCSVDPRKYNCPTPVVSKLSCSHEVQDKPCYMEVTVFKCPFPCDTRVEPCGHACILTCHIRDDPDHLKYKCFKLCERTLNGCLSGIHMCPKICYQKCPPCDILVKKQRSMCLHQYKVPCNYYNSDEIECTAVCKKTLPCGHMCMKKCFQECGDCKEPVYKKLASCKHEVRVICSKEPQVKDCKGKCPKNLACGHPCKQRCNEPCTKYCGVLVNHTKTVDCGHIFKIPCYMIELELSSNDLKLLQYCQQPCRFELLCKHSCSGTCGKCIQGRIHITCKQNCGVPLVCGHACSTPCRQTCQPCTKRCNFKCYHSTCRKTCGEPCTKCVEPCRRRCEHNSCTARCGNLCTVPPCNKPCRKFLKCRHKCVGFCGDPCPPLCRICNRTELCEIFFGSEDEVDARFVLLLECQHVIESRGMEHWLNQDGNGVGYKQCPKCKATLSITERYNDFIKIARYDVMNIKERYFGISDINEAKRRDLLEQLRLLVRDSVQIKSHFNNISIVLENLKDEIYPVRKDRRQPMNMLLIDTFTAKIQILERIIKIFNDAKLENQTSIQNMLHLIELLLRPLFPANQRITNQEIADMDKELNRLMCLAQLSQIEEDLPGINTPEIIQLHTQIKNLIFDIHVFSDNYNITVKEKILELHKKVKSKQIITMKERREIVRAMGMAAGHWFKCPNGHYYAIGECGGAMEKGRCNECRSSIGGTQHRLLTTNKHAGEMDNSKHAAWPPR